MKQDAAQATIQKYVRMHWMCDAFMQGYTNHPMDEIIQRVSEDEEVATGKIDNVFYNAYQDGHKCRKSLQEVSHA